MRLRGSIGSRRSAPVNAQRQPSFSQTEALRVLEQKSKEADGEGSLPESHLKVFQLCGEFLETADRSLASPAVSSERRFTVRARQERVRALQKHHMLSWARDSARLLTHQAHQQARLHEKIESANRALDCIDTALKSYPDNEELRRSGTAVREFMTSSRVAHWVELAQRATFKGRYRRAIDCYRDALFYLTRAGAEHQVAADQITREIELLRARMKTAHAVDAQPVASEKKATADGRRRRIVRAITRKCPRCGSHRIRRGYKRTPWFIRMFGIRSLLCDHCNWLFTGFGILLSPRTSKRRV